LRVRLEVHEAALALASDDAPWVLAFFHGTQFPLLAWRRRRRTAVLVSLSRDGALQARALRILGFEVVRGSSSRGGARGLAALVRLARTRNHDVAFAVDGPRGPLGSVKPGAAFVAARAGAKLVPMGSAVRWGKVFHRAWDRFALPAPFSTVAVVLGPPTPPEALGAAIDAANGRAAALLAGPASSMVPSKPL
jgi:lysophospholipid acyltransferase (LPLAT)-like uncharacterized protein